MGRREERGAGKAKVEEGEAITQKWKQERTHAIACAMTESCEWRGH